MQLFYWAIFAAGALLQPIATAESIVLEPGRKQLFIDDFLIESMVGLKRTVHQPADHDENPVIFPDQPWEHRRIPFGSVYFSAEEKKFRCWYVAMNIYDSRPGFRGYRKEHHVPIHEAAVICYAESEDGIHWKKPNLGLHEFRGSKKNNIVQVCPGTHFDSTSVIHTPHDSERPWKMIGYIGLWPYKKELIEKQWGDHEFGIERHGHYVWSSKDGIHWEPMNGGEPVLRVSDRSMYWWDSSRREYGGSAKTNHEGKRAQKFTRSENATQWTQTADWVHRADARDHPGDEAEAAFGFNYGAQWVGFAEMRRIRDGHPVRINWELLVSRDGQQWNRPIRELFFADGPEEGWRYQVFKIFASPPIEREGELWIYYGGKTGLNDAYTGTGPNQAVCLARLRLDGFVSLDGREKAGHLVTKPLVTKGTDLFLNFAAEENGKVVVEMIDSQSGKVLAISEPVTGDQVRRKVSWKNGSSFRIQSESPARLRVQLHNAELFSLCVE